MPRVFKRDCDHCGNYYEGYGPKHCGIACAGAARTAAVNRGHTLDEAIYRISQGPNTAPQYPLPVRPIEVYPPYIEVPEKAEGAAFTSVHYGDVHFPFQDDAALDVLYAIVRDLQPDLIACHGDLLDCYSISRYEKDPKHRPSLQDEMRQAAEHLGLLTSLAPNAERKFFLGNHEDRLRRIIWDLAKDVPAAQLLTLPNVWESLSWEKLLGAEQLGWKVHESKEVLFGKLILKHGSVVRKWSAFSAKGEYEKYGKSGISGHTHRRGVFEHRDHNGAHAWWEHGCLCNTDPDYCEDPDWQSGFLVVSWTEDRKNFGVEEVRIHEGRAFFRGRMYDGSRVERRAA